MGTIRIRRAAIGSLVAVMRACRRSWPRAQSPAVNRHRKRPRPSSRPTQQVAQPLNNQPVWSEIRSGQPQYTSIPGRETNVLIQPQGQTWRALRVPLATVGGFLVRGGARRAGGVLPVARPHHGARGAPTGRLDRALHAGRARRALDASRSRSRRSRVTGLILTFGKTVLLPLIGYTLFSWLAMLSKNLHNFVGPVLVVAAADHDRAVRAREHFPARTTGTGSRRAAAC